VCLWQAHFVTAYASITSPENLRFKSIFLIKVVIYRPQMHEIWNEIHNRTFDSKMLKPGSQYTKCSIRTGSHTLFSMGFHTNAEAGIEEMLIQHQAH